MRAARILIADDHELVRAGIKHEIELHPEWTVCAEAENGRHAVELAVRHKPDVAVLDIGMPELNGIEAARQIRRRSPEVEVLILTLQESDELMRDALRAGVRGFILKTDAARFLTEAVGALLEHRTFFTGKVSSLLLDGFLDPAAGAAGGAGARGRLTLREIEVVQLLAEGRTSKEIATRLGTSVKTVEAHRANVMRKLDLHSVAAVVRYAIRNRLVEP